MRVTSEALQLSVREFFENVCPKVLDVQSAEAKRLGGSLGFRIFGDQAGAWVVDLGAARVEEGLSFEADAFLELEDQDLLGMLQGTVDLAEAIDAGRVRWRGDLEMLLKLGALLQVAEG